MTKFELLEEKEINGNVWYKIFQDGSYVAGTLTRNLEDANYMLDEFANGKPTTSFVKTIKTIEVKEGADD